MIDRSCRLRAVLTAPADQRSATERADPVAAARAVNRYMMTGFYQPARPKQKAIADVGVPPLMGSAHDAASGIPLGKIVNFWLGNFVSVHSSPLAWGWSRHRPYRHRDAVLLPAPAGPC